MSAGWQLEVDGEVGHLVETVYGIRPSSIERLIRESPNGIWRITTSSDRYLLKRLGRPVEDRWLAFQEAAIGRVADYGVPTELPIRTADGATTASADGARWQLRRFVPGRHCQDGDQADLRAAAQMIASIHAVPVDGLPSSGRNPIQDVEFWLGADESAIDELGALVSSTASTSIWIEIGGGFRDAYRRARAELDWGTYQSLPRTLTHGEIAGSNLVFDDRGKLISLLDWDGVDLRPRAYDLARALLFLARTGRGSFGIHRDLGVELLLGATGAKPLRLAELRALTPVLELYFVPTIGYVQQMAQTGPAALEWYLGWAGKGARTVRETIRATVTELTAHLERKDVAGDHHS